MRVLADSSALIGLTVAGHFDLLRAWSGDVLVMDSVWKEVTGSDPSRAGAPELTAAVAEGWCVRTPLTASPPHWNRVLGCGEADAITQGLALAGAGEEVLLLLDERRARNEARDHGLKATGVLGLLLDAKQAGSIAAIRPAIDRLEAHGFRIGPGLRRHVLTTAGEASTAQPPA